MSWCSCGGELALHGHALVDWTADDHATVEQRAGPPDDGSPGVRTSLSVRPPHPPVSFDDVLTDLDRVVLPGITHWHPGWFAYFPANVSPPSARGELVSAGLGVQGTLWWRARPRPRSRA